MRKSIATFATFALLAVSTVGPVLAATDTNVVNSGDGVVVSTSSTTNTNVNTSVSNSAVVIQNSEVNQNSGFNVLDGNISINGCNPCGVTGGGVGLQVGGNSATVNQSATDINSNVVGVSVDAGSQASNLTGVTNTGNGVTVVTNDTANTNVNTSATNRAFVYQGNEINQNSGFNVLTDNIGSPILAIIGGNTTTVGQSVDGLNSNVVGVAIHAPTSTAGVGCMLCGPCTANVCTGITNTGDGLLVVTSATTNMNINTSASNWLFSKQKSYTNQNSGFNVLDGNIGGGSLGVGGNLAGTTQILGDANSNAIGVSVGSDTLPLGGTMANIINTGNGLVAVTVSTDNNNTNTAAVNALFGFQAQVTSSNSGFNILVNNIGGGVSVAGGNAGGNTQTLSGNSNAALIGSNPLSLLALLMLLL